MTRISRPLRTIDRLREQLREWERSRGTPGTPATTEVDAVERIDEIERLLPGRPGTLVEWLADGIGSGAATLALSCLAASSPEGAACPGLVVIDDVGRGCRFYPPGLPPAIDPERIVVIRPRNLGDAWWALEQSLRCRGVAATIAWVSRADDWTLRRWQLAAEQGGGVGLLLRPSAARRASSWADLRWLVEPLPSLPESQGRRWRLELLYCRRGTAVRASGGAIELEQDHETGAVRVVSRLAVAEAPRAAAGA